MKIAVVTLSEIGNANFGVKVVKTAGVCGQAEVEETSWSRKRGDAER